MPDSRITNYWRDGARPITKDIFDTILKLSGLTVNADNYNDEVLNASGFESEVMEGGSKKQYTTYYERNPALRQQAVEIHGYTCMACEMNFRETYGEWGEGFIHVHHLNPISAMSSTSKINR